MEFQKFYKEFYGIYKPIIEFEQNCLPLCAAESENLFLLLFKKNIS